MKSQKGFTLIELLVVIAVIGILASVVLVSLNSARGKARDAKRMADLKQLTIALALYYDTHGAYPLSQPFGSSSWINRGNCASFGGYPTSGSDGWIPNLAPAYISVLPIDPKGDANRCYLYHSDGVDYIVMAYTTAEGIVPQGFLRGTDRNEDKPNTFALYTSGATWW